jgi:Uma2 family endonuclease
MGRNRATYADLAALPENMVGEIIDGELYTQARPAGPHTVAASALGMFIGPPFGYGRGGPGGWVILDEPELHLGSDPDVLVPDLAGWRRERLPEVPSTVEITVAPDWICEVLSPSTAAKDRAKKLRIYAREGVKHAWLVDPDPKTVEVYRLESEHWVLLMTYAGDEKVRAEPFDAIELELAHLWRR